MPLLVALTAAFSIVYSSWSTLSPGCNRNNPDVNVYVRMVSGEEGHAQFHSRQLICRLVGSIPPVPRGWFSPARTFDPFMETAAKFLLVNFFFLAATGVLFWGVLVRLGFSAWEALAGEAFFFLSRPVVHSAGLPLLDAAGYFFLSWCVYALLTRRFILFVAGFSLGIFCKESLVLMMPAVLLYRRVPRVKLLAWMLPAFCGYALLRWAGWQVSGDVLQGAGLQRALRYFTDGLRVHRFLDWASSFGALWFLAAAGAMKGNPEEPLRCWIPLIVALWLFDLFVIGAYGRGLMYAYWIVIPLVLLGTRVLLPQPAVAGKEKGE